MIVFRRFSRDRMFGAAALFGFFAAGLLHADQTVQVGPDLSFSPSSVTVAPGEAVIWNFLALHSSTSDTQTGPEVWDSGVLSSGTFSHVFNTPGTYPYYCTVHSVPGGTAMNGVVVVSGVGATPTPTATVFLPSATPTPTPTSPVASPTPTATPTLGSPQATPTATPPAAPTATPIGGVPTATPGTGASAIPDLDPRGRIALALALAAAGVAALLLANRR
ncbi:MAG TPA: plastocyanin/azurin family copper-binding protein [Thermoanaerobaculia bacterium]|nr:plastocyanin/azurin family copper-binding protein [Thermoanaerobaculia bacterium]